MKMMYNLTQRILLLLLVLWLGLQLDQVHADATTSGSNSNLPSTTPTRMLTDVFTFQQQMLRPSNEILNTTELTVFEDLIVALSEFYIPTTDLEYVQVECHVYFQQTLNRRRRRRRGTSRELWRMNSYSSHSNNYDPKMTTTKKKERYDVVSADYGRNLVDEFEQMSDSKSIVLKENENDNNQRRQQEFTTLLIKYDITYRTNVGTGIVLYDYVMLFVNYMLENANGSFRNDLIAGGIEVEQVDSASYTIAAPSQSPTYTITPTTARQTSLHRYSQSFIRTVPTEFTVDEQVVFSSYIASLTPDYAPFGLPEVTTTVTVGSQSVSQVPNSTDFNINMDYVIFYDDATGSVDTFDGVSDLFKDFLGESNPGNLVDFLNFLNGQTQPIEVVRVEPVSKIVYQPSPAPTKVLLSSKGPSLSPTALASLMPSASVKIATFLFRHSFLRDRTAPSITQEDWPSFESIIENYTSMYGLELGAPAINTTCSIEDLDTLIIDSDTTQLTVDYMLSYEARENDIMIYDEAYIAFMAGRESSFITQLNLQGWNINSVESLTQRQPMPSSSPTALPTFAPTKSASPTFTTLQNFTATFTQDFLRPPGLSILSPDEILSFEKVIESFTPNYGLRLGPPKIITYCTVVRQVLLSRRRNLRGQWNWKSLFARHLQNDDILTMEYTIFFQSSLSDLIGYDTMFRDYMNDVDEKGIAGNSILIEELNQEGIQIISAERVFINFQTSPPTPAPTISKYPTFAPSLVPASGKNRSTSTATAAIAGGVVSIVVLAILGGGGYYYWRSRQPNKSRLYGRGASSNDASISAYAGNSARALSVNDASELSYEAGGPIKAPSSIADSSLYSSVGFDGMSNNVPSPSRRTVNLSQDEYHQNGNIPATADLSYIQEIPHEESMLSNESLLSMSGQNFISDDDDNPMFPGGTGVVQDELLQLADEFDLYKDQNLERMRAAVGDIVTESDDMMSEALTKALMEDDEAQENIDAMWGGAKDSMEIEASILCDTYEWMKRQERMNIDMKRAYMQDIMNKMVSAVRYNFIGPDDASRAIHGCAALLGMGLAEELPESTIIITGMPKTVTDKLTLISTFREFGDIEDAAMASKSRGFGLVRFRWTKSVNAVMQKHRHDEIVVQDVAVTVRVLRPDMKDAAVEV